MWRGDVPKLWSSLRRAATPVEVLEERDRPISMGEWADFFQFGAAAFPVLSSGSGVNVEDIETSFVGYVRGAYKSDGIVFACMLARQMLFSEARFLWQQLRSGRPGDLFSTPELDLLQRPWPNGTTGELLSRMIQDADLAGNFFAVSEGRRLRRLRPDWVDIVLTAPPDQAVKSDVAGYLYHPGGVGKAEPVAYGPDQVVHWSPVPDPEAQYRGMSWLTPAIREIQADMAATDHKLRFFENGATLQTVLTLGETVTSDQFKTFVRQFREAHQGVHNAYEPLFLGGGADAKVIGTDLRQLDFKNTQGANETRIAADSGIHPVILGLSEGLAGSSLNAGNFNAARRLTADKALRPLWRMAASALETVLTVPPGSRLWFDDRDIAFLREDRKDLAEIQATEGQTIRTLIDAGYEADSVVAAVKAQDWSLLTHSGLFSVQLQKPGSDVPAVDGQTTPAQGDQG
jgi:phage portal protein BeeE